MRIYISGGITNNPDYKTEFKIAESYIKETVSKKWRNLEIINPVKLAEKIDKKNKGKRAFYSTYMKKDIKELLKCDVICLLESWENSEGAKLEKHIAETCGILVMTIDNIGTLGEL